MHKITVLIPVYNGEKYIKRCLDSIVNQTYKNIEIIVINDGSTDATLSLLSKYSNIKVYNKKHEGISLTREYAIKKCKTEYFIFVDSDDYLESNAIEKLYNKMINTNSDIVMGCIDNKLNDDLIITNNKFDYIFNHKIPYYMVLWNKLYKKSIFKNVKFPNVEIGEDDYITLELLKKIKKITVLPCKTYNYCLNENSLTFNKSKYYEDIIYIYKQRYLFFKNTKYEKIAYKQYLDNCIRIYCQFNLKKEVKNKIWLKFKNECKKINLKYLFFKIFPSSYCILFNIKKIVLRRYYENSNCFCYK